HALRSPPPSDSSTAVLRPVILVVAVPHKTLGVSTGDADISSGVRLQRYGAVSSVRGR
ncbi:hypothetical protein FOZ63_004888, partial [Perkinsus olseni]